MIKVNRRDTVPASLLEWEKNPFAYRNEDVVAALGEDFNNKCYICELKPLMDIHVEHLRPHKDGKRLELKFDWNNLFLSCPHCNNVKNNIKYEDCIIDCCVQDPEELMSQRFDPSQRIVLVECIDENNTTKMTAQLIEECFGLRNTAIRKITTQNRLNCLSDEMNILFKALNKYKKIKSKRNINGLIGLLDKSSRFSAFKRQYVRDNLDIYPELGQYIFL